MKAEAEDVAYLYWLRCSYHTDMHSEGYIGVTTRSVSKRFKEHTAAANTISGVTYDYPLSRAIRKYWGGICVTTLCIGTEDYIYYLEKKLRPVKSIGWNMVIGGLGREGSYHTQSDEKLLSLMYEHYVRGVCTKVLSRDNEISRAYLTTVLGGGSRSYLLNSFSLLHPDEVRFGAIKKGRYTDREVFSILNDYMVKCLPIGLLKERYGIGADYVSLLSRGLKRKAVVKRFYSMFGDEEVVRLNRGDKSYNSYTAFIKEVNLTCDFSASCKAVGIKKGQGERYLLQNSRERYLTALGGNFESQTT